MIRYTLAVAVLVLVSGFASAQHRTCAQPQRVVYPTYTYPTYTPPAYAPPAVTYTPPPTKYETIVVVPAAVYTVPGAPTVQINVYPASQTFVQPVAAPAAVLTPEQAGKVQVIPVNVPEGSDVKVIQVPVPIAPNK